MIRVDEDQEVCGIRVNERQIAPIDLPYDQVVPTYRALQKFLKIVYDPSLMISFPLKKVIASFSTIKEFFTDALLLSRKIQVARF